MEAYLRPKTTTEVKYLECKINKYGFVHICKPIYEKLGLSRKTEIPLDVEVDTKKNRIVLTINTVPKAKPKEGTDTSQG